MEKESFRAADNHGLYKGSRLNHHDSATDCDLVKTRTVGPTDAAANKTERRRTSKNVDFVKGQ